MDEVTGYSYTEGVNGEVAMNIAEDVGGSMESIGITGEWMGWW